MLLLPLGDMIFLPVPHFVPDDCGDFVLAAYQAERADINHHDVPHTATGVEALIVGDKVQVRLIVNGGVDSRHATRKIRHNPVEHGVISSVVGDAVFLAEFVVKFLPPFVGVVEVFDGLVYLAVELRTLYADGD